MNPNATLNDKRARQFGKVREVEIPRWDDEEQHIVFYEVVVIASGGRRWTLRRRYQDFQDLENQTWHKRGPMPPFPMPWTPGQLSRRVNPFGRVGRLEAKRIMLEAWLRQLIAKARHRSMIQLRFPICLFLDVVPNCTETTESTPLELVNNDVTSLIFANVQVDVQTILLKLSSEVERMQGDKGKEAMAKAKEGPMDVALQPVDLYNPPKWLLFDLNQPRPTVRLLMHNSTDHRVAFKVMATRATRYFVQPAQTIFGPGEQREVAVFIPDPVGAFEDDKDRFMFMSVKVDEDLSRAQLSGFWKGASAQNTAKFRLVTRFRRRDGEALDLPVLPAAVAAENESGAPEGGDVGQGSARSTAEAAAAATSGGGATGAGAAASEPQLEDDGAGVGTTGVMLETPPPAVTPPAPPAPPAAPPAPPTPADAPDSHHKGTNARPGDASQANRGDGKAAVAAASSQCQENGPPQPESGTSSIDTTAPPKKSMSLTEVARSEVTVYEARTSIAIARENSRELLTEML